MLPDRVSNPGPLTYESGAIPIALRGRPRRQDLGFKSRPKDWKSEISIPRLLDEYGYKPGLGLKWIAT